MLLYIGFVVGAGIDIGGVAVLVELLVRRWRRALGGGRRKRRIVEDTYVSDF